MKLILFTALLLIPFAPVGVKLGVMLLHKVSQERIYQLCYAFLFFIWCEAMLRRDTKLRDGISQLCPSSLLTSKKSLNFVAVGEAVCGE